VAARCPAAVRSAGENAPSSAFCEDCGAALSGNVASAATDSPQVASTAPQIRVTLEQPDASTTIEGERKTVTALFADIKGSMELMEDLDPEEARVIIDPALKLMIESVHHYDGYVVQSTGDGIFALFGAPLAHEDHPQRALYAAVRLQEQMRTYADQLRARGNPPIQARVGVNTGEVVVRDRQREAGIHANRTFDQPCRANAGARADRIDSSDRHRGEVVRGLLQLQDVGTGEGQRR
jgi:class 3 adenylate cyclase